MTFCIDVEETGEGCIHLMVVVDEDGVWPHPRRVDAGSDFDPEDVVDWLTDAWPSLQLAQAWPIQFHPDQEPRSITGLLKAAEDRWDQFGEGESDEADSESSLVDAFLYAHDLRQMKHGADLNACLVLRQHTRMRLETNGRVYEDIKFADFILEINKLGNFAVRILKKRNDYTSKKLINRWNEREQIDALDAAALLSGIPASEIQASSDLMSAFTAGFGGRGVSAIANDNNNPVSAAARSSGVLGPAGLAEVLCQINGLPDGESSKIASFRRQIQARIRGIERPLDQGIQAANSAREWLGLTTDKPVELDVFCERLGVRVVRQAIPDPRLDGIATIGPRHGPAIVLNTMTRRQGAGGDDLERSLRFTWAHEIGHLLLDHDEWASLVDATRQGASRSVETRANAFATYLLLPHGAAYRAWDRLGSPRDWPALESLLNSLTGQFGLPRIVASRQLAREANSRGIKDLQSVFRVQVENFDGR